jgi:pyruvate kinase
MGSLNNPVSAIVTIPPYAPFLEEVAAHPLVSGLRLNTVMPIKGSHREILKRLASLQKPLYVDLKGRQLRVVGSAVPPFTEVIVSHTISVPTPVDAWFSDGREHARIVAVDGNRLILEDGPRRYIGPGESINIPHTGLIIQGSLTETDKRYLEAMKELGLKQVMLSFVEREEDVAEVQALLPGASVIQKIESVRGLDYIRKKGCKAGRLMAARGDLFVEVPMPHRILTALKWVVEADADAILASRLFGSLSRQSSPEASDISDAALMLMLGYKTLMLGDEVCLRRDSVIGALNLLSAVAAELA